MYYYLYQITNLINGRYYCGVHKSDSLTDNYLGSGIAIDAAKKKYGIENFSKVILEQFSSEKEMYAREKEVVNLAFITDPQTYNIALGGHGGDRWTNHPDQDRYRAKLSNTNLTRMAEMSVEERSSKFGNHGEKNPFYGKQHPSELLAEMQAKKSATWAKNKSIWMHTPTGENVRVHSVDIDSSYAAGYKKGYAPGTHPNNFRKPKPLA